MLTTIMQRPDHSREERLVRHDKTGEAFLVRPYDPGDRSALARFYEEFEPKGTAQGLPPRDPGRIVEWLATVLPQGLHVVAERDGELIGHALVVPTNRAGISEYAVFVRQDQRGRGVGTEFSHAAVEMSRATGLRGLWLTVEPHNRAAIRSYERVGFRMIPGTIFSPEAEMEMEL